MSSKKQRKEMAMKKSKKKKQIVIMISAIVLLAICGLVIFALHSERNTRVFTDGRKTVSLMANGSFNAQLAHGVNKRGTYYEEVEDGTITVTFVTDRGNVQGSIAEGILTLPSEWDDGCGHNDRLPQSRGPQ